MVRFMHREHDTGITRIVEVYRPLDVEDMAARLEADGYGFFSDNAFGDVTMWIGREGSMPLASVQSSERPKLALADVDALIHLGIHRAFYQRVPS